MNTNEKIATYIMGESKPINMPSWNTVFNAQMNGHYYRSYGANWIFSLDYFTNDVVECTAAEFNRSAADLMRLINKLSESGIVKLWKNSDCHCEYVTLEVSVQGQGVDIFDAVCAMVENLIAKRGY